MFFPKGFQRHRPVAQLMPPDADSPSRLNHLCPARSAPLVTLYTAPAFGPKSERYPQRTRRPTRVGDYKQQLDHTSNGQRARGRPRTAAPGATPIKRRKRRKLAAAKTQAVASQTMPIAQPYAAQPGKITPIVRIPTGPGAPWNVFNNAENVFFNTLTTAIPSLNQQLCADFMASLKVKFDGIAKQYAMAQQGQQKAA